MSSSAGFRARLLIGGEWTGADSGRTVGVENPATEEILAEVPNGGTAETRRALEAAHRALPGWRKALPYERAKVLKKTAELMRQRADSIARTMTLEQGKPLAESMGEVLHSADTFEWFAEEGKRAYGQVIPHGQPGRRHLTVKHPVGVVAAISPWNFPVTLQSRKIAPALAAGCTVVSRPATQTPLCLIQVFECLVDAGLPAGVANLVVGTAREMADEFLANPVCRKISFTGSTEVGKGLMRAAADQVKRLSLELGGHAPFIVFPDAEPEAAAKVAVMGKFRNNGQVCIAPSRFFVHSSIRKKFTEAAVEITRALKQGNGLDAGVEVGPMFEKKALDHSERLVNDARSKGAKVLIGGARNTAFARGHFYKPTILDDVSPACAIIGEEPFAPLMPIMGFDSIEDVIGQANNTRYGLAAYVYTNDLSTAFRMADGLEAGIIGINDPVPATPQCPFGGMKESGMGRELAHEGLEAYLETKYLAIRIRE